MAKIFFDVNYFIDLMEERQLLEIDQFSTHQLYLSPVSIHIYTYIYKIKIPNQKLQKTLDNFNLIPIDEFIASNSLSGPTADFEDNLQLHSSAWDECDYFLTNDRRLLSLYFFGKVQIANSL